MFNCSCPQSSQYERDISGGSGFARYLKHFENEEKCAVCQLTRNYRGWLSTFADQLW